MQLNIYIPKDKSHVIKALEDVSQATKRQKNELVLEALERYLPKMNVELGKFSLGQSEMPKRGKLYESRLDR